jgi:hypothetical protein
MRILKRDPQGRAELVQLGANVVEFTHLDSQGLLLANCYHDNAPCPSNQIGLCEHCQEVLFGIAQEAGIIITVTHTERAADILTEQLKGRVACCFRSGQANGQNDRQFVIVA